MRLDPRLLNWGVFFIVLGAVPLAVRQGLLDRSVAGAAWGAWPLLLVGAGLGLVLRRTPLEALGGLVVAGAFGFMAGGFIAAEGDVGSFGACGDEREAAAFPARDGRFAEAASVEIEFDCGTLTVAAEEGSSWGVEGTDESGTGPSVEASTTELRIEDRSGARGPFGFLGTKDAWQVVLPAGPSLDVRVSATAGEAAIDLRATELAGFSLSVNAGSARVDLDRASLSGTLAVSVNAGTGRIVLPQAGFSGELSVNAGSLRICAPEGAALRIAMADNVTGSNNFVSRGLIRSGDAYETPGFGSATDRITLQASANAGSITLNPDGGCA